VNAWKVILATVLIFGTGVVTGALITRRAGIAAPPRQGKSASPAAAPALAPGLYRLEFLRRAQRELNLSPEQRERVDGVFRQSQERAKRLMEPVAPELRAELDRAKAEFREILTPEQRNRFDSLLKQRFRDPRHDKSARPRDKDAATNAAPLPGI
jgi:Spy/CpxP family protein refolding chaperone